MEKIIVALLMLNLSFALTSQSDDPAIQEAKEKTVVIFDLGRFFGLLNVMEEEAPELALSKNQMTELYTTLDRFLRMERIEVIDADETLLYMEEKLLTLNQLIYVDGLAIEKMETRVSKSSSGNSSGGGQLSGYVAGGPFNPLIDETKIIGQDVAAFMEYLKKKLGK